MEPEQPARERIRAELDAEAAALRALLERISDAEWHSRQRADGWTIHDIVSHIADSSYGISRMVTLGLPPGVQLDVHARNAERRERLRDLPRPEVERRVGSGFATARDALATVADMDAPGPAGSNRTVGEWLALIPLHNASHREEIEQLLAGDAA